MDRVSNDEFIDVMNYKRVDYNDFLIKCPARIVMYGISMVGKSSSIVKMCSDSVRKYLFDVDFERIVYCIPPNSQYQRQKFLEDFRTKCKIVEFFEGIPKISQIVGDPFSKKHQLLILDDLFTALKTKIPLVEELFSTISHHNNTSIILVAQSLFKSDISRIALRGFSHLMIFQSKGDSLTLRTLSQQLFPGYGNVLQRILNYVKEHYDLNYIFIDFSVLSGLNFRYSIKTRIYPNDKNLVSPIVFDLDDECFD